MSLSKSTGRRNVLPIVYTNGTYYEVGFDVGCTFRSLIQEYLKSSSWLHDIFLPAYETEVGRHAYDTTLASVQENFPQYIRELQGTADGAEVPFHHLMLFHMDRIVSMAGKNEHRMTCTSGDNGCSSLSINNEDEVLLGHTEDALMDMINYCYLVSASITEEQPQGKLGIQRESFTAFCYPGHLPGFCSGYNRYGLVFSINVICPQKVIHARTPRHILCRALLAATSLEAAHTILKDSGTGAADGFSVNMVFMQQEGKHDFQIVEVGPTADHNQSAVTTVTLNPGEHYFHANKYLHLTNVPEIDGANFTTSDRRKARASQFPDPKNLRDMLQILSDTKDVEYPIFRENPMMGQSRTLALGVFDLVKKTWTTWMNNPKKAESVMIIPLLFNWDVVVQFP